jgi:phosphopantothenate-cysteine ligase/phosphopantothenoylcysteine decarboxylase/phosphopantothenate--cysteine ligase
VTLLTSHPEVVAELLPTAGISTQSWAVHPYRTFDDLQELMKRMICGGRYNAIIHCAAVSDYQSAGIYAPVPGTQFDVAAHCWRSEPGHVPALVDRASGKVKSDENELWLRLVRTPKLVDLIRGEWGFGGILVKFKLEVGVSDEHLLQVSERSRRQSGADLMVANTLESMDTWALLGPFDGEYKKIQRSTLADSLLDTVEHLHAAKHPAGGLSL